MEQDRALRPPRDSRHQSDMKERVCGNEDLTFSRLWCGCGLDFQLKCLLPIAAVLCVQPPDCRVASARNASLDASGKAEERILK